MTVVDRPAAARGLPTTAVAAAATSSAGPAADAAPAVGLSDADRRALVAALARDIEPVKVSPLYTAGLVLVAVTMLLLPLVYLALIAGAAYGTWWYALNGANIFRGGGNAKGKLLVYVAPLIVGGLLVLFMVKPLFAKRSKRDEPLSLDPAREPLLFAFVERLCAIVGASMPVRIDVDCQVNASAGFKNQGPFGWMTRRLVLTIGLPLAAGLDVRQFAGVLAHEFGHFAQGTGMRLTFVIRSVNHWFARVVYERDSWDDFLRTAGGEFGVVGLLICWLARAMVWLTRRILWCLMVLGNAISSFMLRQMEYDADQYEARVAGVEAFEQTTRLLQTLNLGQSAALDELQQHWRERRLCDDLPALVRHREREMPADLRQKLHDAHAKRTTGWFDSHPCDADRIASVRRTSPPGIITVDAPAASLFADFCGTCKRVTGEFYKNALGEVPEDAEVVTADEVVGKRQEQKQKYAALERYFQGLVHAVRPVFPDDGQPLPATREGAAEVILNARSAMAEQLPAARAAAKAWSQSMDRLIGVTRATARVEAGYKRFDPKDLGLNPGDQARLPAVGAEQSAAAGRARAQLDALLAEQMYRLRCALEIERLDRPAPPPLPTDAQESGGAAYTVNDQPAPVFGDTSLLLAALAVLSRTRDASEGLRVSMLRLGELIGQLRPENNSEHLIERVLSASRETAGHLHTLHTSLAAAWYPYEHGERGVTLSKYIVPQVPDPQAVGNVYDTAGSALEGVFGLYARLLSDLSSRAEAAEASLGLDLLPEPPEEEEEAKPTAEQAST